MRQEVTFAGPGVALVPYRAPEDIQPGDVVQVTRGSLAGRVGVLLFPARFLRMDRLPLFFRRLA